MLQSNDNSVHWPSSGRTSRRTRDTGSGVGALYRWQAAKATISPGTLPPLGTLVDGVQTWGQTFPTVSGSPTHFVLAFLPPRLVGGTQAISSLLIDDVFIRLYDGTTGYDSFSDRGPYTITFPAATGSITPATSFSFSVTGFNFTENAFPKYSWAGDPFAISITGSIAIPAAVVESAAVPTNTGTFTFGNVANPLGFAVPTFTGTMMGNTGSSALNLNLPGNTLSVADVETIYSSSATPLVRVTAILYVSQFNVATGLWETHDAGLILPDFELEYLDLFTDVYRPLTGEAFGFTSRGWVMDIPYPITLTDGQALVLSFSCVFPFGGVITLVPFLRSRITVIV